MITLWQTLPLAWPCFFGPESDDCLALSVTNSCFWDLIHHSKLDVIAVADINVEDSVDKRLLAANSLTIAWRKLFVFKSQAATCFANAESQLLCSLFMWVLCWEEPLPRGPRGRCAFGKVFDKRGARTNTWHRKQFQSTNDEGTLNELKRCQSPPF